MRKTKCPCCGKRADKNLKYCPHCDFALTPPTPEEQERLLERAFKELFTPLGYFSADFAIIKAAARKGNAQAQCCMGDIYAYGYENIEEDRRKAKKWYKRSAAQGYGKAIERLENMQSD